MNELNLKWWQADALKEQLDAANEAKKLGVLGRLTISSGCTVEWDGFTIKIEIPEEEFPLYKIPKNFAAVIGESYD